MSAIGLLPRPVPKTIISRHADYRRDDFVFQRTQSCSMRDMPWENRTPRLQSWDRLIYSGAGFAVFAVALLELFR